MRKYFSNVTTCLCETKLKPTDPEPKIIGYQTFRLDHCANLEIRAHGGIIIFVKNNYSFVKRNLELSTNSIEALGLDIFERRRSARVGVGVLNSELKNDINNNVEKVGGKGNEDGLVLRLICYYRRPKSDKNEFLKWIESTERVIHKMSSCLNSVQEKQLKFQNYFT